MKFNSQICTSREQSERLLSLGLKKETADMVHFFSKSLAQDWTIVPLADGEVAKNVQGIEIPAWSLHRLMYMLPNVVKAEKPFENSFSSLMNIMMSTLGIAYYYEDYDGNRIYMFECFGNLMTAVVDAIEWLINEGYFNKEYLENEKD